MLCDRATSGLPTAACLHACSAHLGQFDDVGMVQLLQHSNFPGDVGVRMSPGHCAGTGADGCSQHACGVSRVAFRNSGILPFALPGRPCDTSGNFICQTQGLMAGDMAVVPPSAALETSAACRALSGVCATTQHRGVLDAWGGESEVGRRGGEGGGGRGERGTRAVAGHDGAAAGAQPRHLGGHAVRPHCQQRQRLHRQADVSAAGPQI